MKAYTVNYFLRNDENLQYCSGVEGVFTSKRKAVECAKIKVAGAFSEYGHKEEREKIGGEIYYCCLDSDPNNDSTYPDYLIIEVQEFEMQ